MCGELMLEVSDDGRVHASQEQVCVCSQCGHWRKEEVGLDICDVQRVCSMRMGTAFAIVRLVGLWCYFTK